MDKVFLPAPGQGSTLLIPGPGGMIEAQIATPREAAQIPGFAVVCHPHPLMGGAMSNKVAYTLASTANKAGLHALRFNFRGVGKSEGAHDHGRGETDDVLFLVEWMRERLPGARTVLAGFSFGAYVSLLAAERARPDLQVSIAPPFIAKYLGSMPRPGRPPCPWLVVHGTGDEVVDYGEATAELARYSPPPELVSPVGVGHFFHGRLGDITEAMLDFMRRNGFPAPGG